MSAGMLPHLMKLDVDVAFHHLPTTPGDMWAASAALAGDITLTSSPAIESFSQTLCLWLHRHYFDKDGAGCAQGPVYAINK